MENPIGTHHRVRRLILDYALGAAIIALFPIPRIRILKAIALLILHYKLLRGIGRVWRSQKGGGLLARFGIIAGIAGSIALGGLGWIGAIALGTVIPNVDALAAGVAFFCYFWSIGQTVNHFYLSGLGRPGASRRVTAISRPSSSKTSQDET